MYRFRSLAQAQNQGQQMSMLPAVSLLASFLGAAWMSYRAWDFAFRALTAVKAVFDTH
jgi:hypothetical protein